MKRPLDPLAHDLRPMEAKLATALPDDPGWQFEPKWDGFRALAGRRDERVSLLSKAGKPLARYFPEIADMLRALPLRRFLVDCEILLRIGDHLSFDALQQRLHPAASRIERLSRETPAQLMLFDCLATGEDDLDQTPLAARRQALETFHRINRRPGLLLSPRTDCVDDARRWLERSGGALDGVVAKSREARYAWGDRAMIKVKLHRSADCVIGGYRCGEDGETVASLLLGLYNEVGALDHVGFIAGLAGEDRSSLTRRLKKLAGGTGFTGKAPNGPSRWSGGRQKSWQPVEPALVAEVRYDQVTGNRFRHGTRLLRWRPDKAPEQCTLDQLRPELAPAEVEAILRRP
ncbi:MAG: ATP-dependent DNA ligase [Sphingomonas sp.]